jgi:hypothetical protein
MFAGGTHPCGEGAHACEGGGGHMFSGGAHAYGEGAIGVQGERTEVEGRARGWGGHARQGGRLPYVKGAFFSINHRANTLTKRRRGLLGIVEEDVEPLLSRFARSFWPLPLLSPSLRLACRSTKHYVLS